MVYMKQCKYCKKEKEIHLFTTWVNKYGVEKFLPKCKDCKNETTRAWRVDNISAQNRWIRYKITETKWWALFNSQGKCCAICKSTTPKTSRDWHTDHNPVTKRVRGILCNDCNHIVHKNITVEILSAAIEYLGR